MLGRTGSCVSGGGFGDVDRRVGTKASLSLLTGEVPRFAEPTSMVLACRGVGGSSEEAEGSTRVASDWDTESRDSELIKGEERVR